MMLGVAVWMLGRILPGPVTLALWAALAFVTGYWLLTTGPRRRERAAAAVRRGFGDCWHRLRRADAGRRARRSQRSAAAAGRLRRSHRGWRGDRRGRARRHRIQAHQVRSPISSVSSPRHRPAGQTVMLDFYADWCVSCKEMEKYTFPEPACRPRSTAPCCCRPTSRPTTRPTRRCCSTSASSVRRRSCSSGRRRREARTIAWSASSRPTSSPRTSQQAFGGRGVVKRPHAAAASSAGRPRPGRRLLPRCQAAPTPVPRGARRHRRPGRGAAGGCNSRRVIPDVQARRPRRADRAR